MASHLSALFADWLAAEPLAVTSLLLAAFLLFVTGLLRVLSGSRVPGAQAWRIIALCAKTMAFVTLAWCGWFLLRSSNTAFTVLLPKVIAGGEGLRKQRAQTITNWGGSLDQSELRVQFSVTKDIVQEFPQGDNKPLLYLRKQSFEVLEQDGLVGFHGAVNLHVVDAARATYQCAAVYQYDVLNGADLQATAYYSFPFSSTRLYSNVAVKLDGKPVAWTISNGALVWTAVMSPHQQSSVEISFETRGVGSFSYTVPTQREIRNYSLTVSSDSAVVNAYVTPDSRAILYSRQALQGAKGVVMQWSLDHAIMSPRISVQFAQPPATNLSTAWLGMFNYAARGLVLLIALIALTLIICGEQPSLARLALIGSLVCAQFLALIAVYPYWSNYLWPVWLFSLVTLSLSYLLLRRTPRLPLVLALLFVLIFCAAYPFVGLIPGERERNAIDGSLQAGMILYLFGLTLYTRIRAAR